MTSADGRGFCPDCIVGLRYDKIVERGATMQLVCPNCGKFYHQPVWGGKIRRKRSVGSALRKLR